MKIERTNMATEDELRRLGLGLGADPRYTQLRRIFGQPAKQPETVQSTLSPALQQSQSNVGVVEKIGRDGQPFFAPDSSQSATIQPVFGPTQFFKLFKNTIQNSTFATPDTKDPTNKKLRDDIGGDIVPGGEEETIDFSKLSDKELVASSLAARGLKNSKSANFLLNILQRGVGTLSERQINNALINRPQDVQLAARISELRNEKASPFSLVDAIKGVFGKGARDIAEQNLQEANDVLSLEAGLENVSARSGPTQAQQEEKEQEGLLAAEQFTGPNTQQIANQQKQQEQQQQQQLARQIGQGSVDDIDTSVDVPTVDGTDPSGAFDPGSGSFAFEEGGKIQKMQEGGEVAEAPAGEGMEIAGVINNPNAAPAGANADDVPMDVPEGSFIINAEAVQEVGLKDIYKAMDEAIILILKTGLGPQLPEQFRKEDRETVPILASNGEVMIPPIIAKMIGEETLNKWNNKGRAIQEAKAAEEQQRAEQQAQQQQAPVMEAPMQQGMA